MVYFNEIEPYAAAWLKNLWPWATVDTRSITDVAFERPRVRPRRHFFAGIGGWEYALALAGWPAEREVWTGSCPCQPFSQAGKRLGERDHRHLWPVFRDLIAEHRPATVFGEQVASRAGRDWLARVRSDLEALGYAVGAADLCAAGVGAPHIRQRLYWVADAYGGRLERRGELYRYASAGGGPLESTQRYDPRGRRPVRRVGDADSEDVRRDAGATTRTEASGPGSGDVHRRDQRDESQPASADGRVGYADSVREGSFRSLPQRPEPQPSGDGEGVGRLGYAYGAGLEGWGCGPDAYSDLRAAWSASEPVPCSDGKTRRTQPGVRPVVDGFPGRVGRLRAYGNAIVPQVAAAFVRAFLDTE